VPSQKSCTPRVGTRAKEGKQSRIERFLLSLTSDSFRTNHDTRAQRRTMIVGTSLCWHVNQIGTDLQEMKGDTYDVTPVSTIFSATVCRPRR
jgi:hypothetical protein